MVALQLVPTVVTFTITLQENSVGIAVPLGVLSPQMVPAVVGAYQCNGTVDWLEEEHPYYPPTVNDPAAAEFAKSVVGKLLGKSNVSVHPRLIC
jgi:IAA-amino acid hydrolase